MSDAPFPTPIPVRRKPNGLLAALGILLFAGLLAVLPFALGTDAEPEEPGDTQTVFTDVPLDIQLVAGKVNDREIECGYRVVTQHWVVVTDRGAIRGPGSSTGRHPDKFSVPTDTMAALSRLAKKHNEQVTFFGIPTEERIDGKRVLIALSMSYKGEIFRLRIKD